MKVSKVVSVVLVVLLIPNILLFGAQEKVPDAVKKAQAKLTVDPNDGEANLTVGKYLVGLEKWTEALEALAKCSDPNLKTLALKDDESTKDPQGVGDGWLEAAKKNGSLKQPMIDRAIFWYGKAWAQTVDAAEKTKMRGFFYKLAQPPPGYEKPAKNGEVAFGWATADTIGSFIDPAFAKSGRRSLKLLPNKGKEGAYVDSQQIPVVVGKKYTFTAWVYSDKTDADGKFDVRIYAANDPTALVLKSFVIPQDCPYWQKIGGEIEVPDKGFRALIHLTTPATTGAVWVDDVRMVVAGTDAMKNGGFEEKK